MTDFPAPRAPRRVRVLQAVYDGDWELYRHFRRYLLIAVAWAAVTICGSFLLGLAASFMGQSSLSALSPMGIAMGWVYLLAILAVWITAMFAIARTCHRSLILGEPPSIAAAFRFDAAFKRFARTAILVILVILGLSFVGIQLSADVVLTALFSIGVLDWFVVLILALLLSIFALALPIAATSSRKKPIRSAVALSAGHRARLFGIVLLGAAPIPLVYFGVHSLLTSLYSWLPGTIVSGWIIWLTYFLAGPTLLGLCAVVLAGAISSAYLQLAGDPVDRDIARVFD